MNSHHSQAEAAARAYIGTTGPLRILGWGVDGVVYLHPLETTAIKIHRGPDGFARELAVYLRLLENEVTEFHGFAVPLLANHDADLRIIEMSVVKPPFLLDFAAAILDDTPDFTDDALSDWWDKVEFDFGDDFPVARDVFWALVHTYGIYYWDLKPQNLRFR